VHEFVSAFGTCGYHITVVDGPAGDARVVERSATHVAVRRPVDGLLPGVVLERRPGSFVGATPPPGLPRSDVSSDHRYGRLAARTAATAGPLDPTRLRAWFGDAAGGLRGPGTLHRVVLLPRRFAGWVSQGPDAPAGSETWFDFAAELSRHGLPRLTRARLERAFGGGTLWDAVEEPVAAVETDEEPAGTGRPYRVRHVTMPSAAVSGVPANDILHARIYEPAAAAFGTVIFLPMWKGHERDAEDVIARALAARGVRVALMPMTYQWQRSPPGTRSGSLTVSADAAATRASIAQTAADAERLAHWLSGRAGGRIGIMGLSLGGFVAAGLFGADPQFGCGIFVLTGGEAADAMFSGAPDVRTIRDDLDRRGITREEARHTFAPLSPDALADPTRGERVLLVNALFDQVISPGNADALRRAWGHPDRFIVPGGHHTALLFLDPFLDRCEAHLRRWLAWPT
jgi:hypothetical protein